MYRLPAPLCPDSPRGEKVRFSLDGQILEGFTHESLAAAILASGRSVLSRSLRFHRPRAMFCSTGECGWCAMEVDAVPSVLTCSMPCRENLIVRSQNAWPSAEWDVFALLDLARPFLPYTFFHRRLLRPKLLRQFYLRALRAFTGLGRLAPSPQTAGRVSIPGKLAPSGSSSVDLGTCSLGKAPAVAGKREVSVETDVAVVGGGLAGMSAALAAAESGAAVVLLEDQETLGGSGRFRRDTRDMLREIISRAAQAPTFEYWPRSLCAGLYAPGSLGVVTPQRLVTLKAKQIILAPGALDALPLFVDNDLPGVISARLVERLLTVEGIAPGKRAVIWGASALARRVIDLMGKAGIKLVRQLREGESIIGAKGTGKVRAALIRGANGRTQTVHCDLIVIAALQPRNELLAQAGGEVRWSEASGGLIAVRDRLMETTVEGARVVGEAAGPLDAARCIAEGRLAGLAAARCLGFDVGLEIEALATEVAQMPREPTFPFPGSSRAGGGHVCFCEDVAEREIRGEMEGGYDVPELVKRRTGIVTGPCQGKFCLGNAQRLYGQTSGPPTARPPAKPIRLGDLVVNTGGNRALVDSG